LTLTEVFLNMQVFFAPNATDTEWKVVLQKESRSKREEAEQFDGVLGAPGRPLPSTMGDDGSPFRWTATEADEVDGAHVRMVDAEREGTSHPIQLGDCDWIDDDDDDDEDGREDDDEECEEVDGDFVGL
jgi:hypothetical protein